MILAGGGECCPMVLLLLLSAVILLFSPALAIDGNTVSVAETTTTTTTTSPETKTDPCCSYPCLNGGVCVAKVQSVDDDDDGFTCDCVGLDFYGKHCETPFLMKRLTRWLRPAPDTVQYILTHYPWLWTIVNNVGPLRRFVMKYIYLSRGGNVDTPPRYTSAHEYVTLEGHLNRSYYVRTLPPVPLNCPTPAGVSGNSELPQIDDLVDKLFRRRRFVAEPHGTNMLFVAYAQHFTHQFFKTDRSRGPGFTWGGDGVDASHLYGKDVATQNKLRSFRSGKLKTQTIDGEEFPPPLSEVHVDSDYPSEMSIPDHLKFAFGHPFFGYLPSLFVMSTVWLREHNRVCDLLVKWHVDWDDERIFQTARLIIVGEMIKITIEEYVQHLSQYNLRLTFEPELTHGTAFQYSNRIHVEFNQLYHWHAMVPDQYVVCGTSYDLKDLYFNASSVFKHGLDTYVNFMVRQRAGKLSRRNHGHDVLHIVKKVIDEGRTLRLQPFNKYRERYGLKAYTNFHDLAGDDEIIATELQRLYRSVDAVEFAVGILVERDGYGVTPGTMVEMGGPYSIKGLMANPLCSPGYWRPSTFGGAGGFELVNTATLQRLFCENMSRTRPCPRISFTVPDSSSDDVDEPEVKTEL